MRILGLHFGHDAGVAVIEDGKVRFLAHAERLLRTKRASGLSYAMITGILERAGLRPDDIDFCAITSTQGIDVVLDDRFPMSIEFARHPQDTLMSRLEGVAQAQKNRPDMRVILDPSGVGPDTSLRQEKRIGVVLESLRIPMANASALPMLNRNIIDLESPPMRKKPLGQLSEDLPASVDDLLKYKFDFNYPATLILDGRRIPAAFVSHHAAHAAATFYQSPFEKAAIMTLDGGLGRYEGGLFWYGAGNRIVPLRMHYLELGQIYLWTAHKVLNLGGSAEGKMMGLAPYGDPSLFESRFIANANDEISRGGPGEWWANHLAAQLNNADRYVAKNLGNQNEMTTPVNADLAASTQKLFEETMLAATRQLLQILANMGQPLDTLCLSGGCMLNCPTNTRISQETAFKNVYVEPACDDGGLPAGAALWAYYNLMGHVRTPTDPVKAGVPYLGLPLKRSEFESAVSDYADRIVVSHPVDVAAEGARRLVAGEVIGWFEGRSEIGPRALGHRSIVADPRGEGTWHRVNTIKGRELWRPLAPSVLEEHAAEWFSGMPEKSPFMMFVGTVTRPDVPAIRHIDGTARVQTVSPECGGYYKLIKQFHALTGCAVVLNTSMNGPGEPIAEYPADAIAMLLDGRFDTLFLEDMVIERSMAHPPISQSGQ